MCVVILNDILFHFSNGLFLDQVPIHDLGTLGAKIYSNLLLVYQLYSSSNGFVDHDVWEICFLYTE